MAAATPTTPLPDAGKVDEKENVELIVINGQKFEVHFDVTDNKIGVKLVPISNNPIPDPEPDKPAELGTVKPGGWGGDITDPTKWSVVSMKDNPALSKIVDQNKVNIATGFTSKEIAEAVIKFIQKIGWAEFEKLLAGGPTTPPPQPGGGGGGTVGKNVYKTTGKSMVPKSTGFKIRHYASGKPDDTTIEFNAAECPYDAFEATGDFTIGKPEHDDRLDVKMYGPRHQDGKGAWYIFAIQFSDGETSFGIEQPHPKTDSSVATGKTFGNIEGSKTIGFKGVIWPLSGGGAHVEGYIDLKDGKGWQLALQADNPGGKKFKRDGAQQIQFRIDAAPQLKGENVIVEEIAVPPVPVGSGGTDPDPNPNPGPTPGPKPPTGEGWTSAGRWDKNGSRTITKHMETDPKDNTVALAAGGNNRKLVIDGNGKAILSGNQARIYIFQPNYDAVLQLKYIHTKELENLSLKLRSRHQEEDPPENRFGGYGSSIALDHVQDKREEYHNEHTTLGEQPLEKKLEAGKEYGVRYTVRDIANGVNNVTEIDYNDGKGFVKVADFTDTKPLDYMRDKKLCSEKSYAWIRTNGDDSTKEVPIWDVSVKPL